MTAKEIQEQAFFRRFQSTVPELEQLGWQQQECPDFLVETPDQVVGVEVTEVLVSDSLKAAESFRSRIIQSAKSEYDRAVKEPLLVSVLFRHGLRLPRRDAEALGVKLGRLIAEQSRLEEVGRIDRGLLPRGVSFVLFAKLVEGARPTWGATESGAIPELSTEAISVALSKKEARLADYAGSCDEVWLLIVVRGSRPSSFFEMAGQALAVTYTSSFGRVYVLDYQGGESHRLLVQKPA